MLGRRKRKLNSEGKPLKKVWVEVPHPMAEEPEHHDGKFSKSVFNFFLAVIFIVVFSAVSIYGLYELAKYFPEKVPWSSGQKISGKGLPEDIPLYNGAVLVESEATASKMTFRYMLPLGAQSTARNFYMTEMIKRDWRKLAANERYLEFYKDEGKRRTVIRISYMKGRASLYFEITGKNN